MIEATYAIDRKRQKSLSDEPGQGWKLLTVAEATEALLKLHQLVTPRPGAPDVAEAMTYLERFRTDAAVRDTPPTPDQLEALWGRLARSNAYDAKLSLFHHLAGPEWMIDRALRGGRYAWDSSKQTLVAGEPLRDWALWAVLHFVVRRAPHLREYVRSACREASLPLDDRTKCASLLADRAWANELAREWMETGDPHGGFQTASLVFGLIDDPDRFVRFGESFGDRLRWAGNTGRIGRTLEVLPAPFLERYLVTLLDRAVAEKWSSSEVDPWTKLLAQIRGSEAARAIAQWVGEKSVAKVANEYFRKHPDLAADALTPVAKTKGKAGPIARAMLDSIAREAALDPAKDSAPRTEKTRAKPTAPSTDTALPKVLVDPPWLSKAPRARPRLALALLVDEERFTPAKELVYREPAWERTPEHDAKILAGRAPDEVVDHELFGLTDACALDVLAKRRRPVNAYSMERLAAWLRDAAVPYVIAAIAADPEHSAYAIRRAASSRLALPAARMAARRSGSARMAFRAWLAEHPEDAALGLVPAALGDDDLDADVAAQALRTSVKAGHRALVTKAAARYGEVASEAIERVLDASPYERFPTKLPLKPKWALPERVGTLETSGGPLTPAQGEAFVRMLQFSEIGDPYPGAIDTITLATEASRTRLARALLDEYLLAGSPPSHVWVVGAITLLDPAASIPRLRDQMRRWGADGKVPLLHASLEALAAIGTDEALVVVYDAGQRSRYDDTRDKVREILEGVARERAITYELLEDQLVPELGLEAGAVTLDLGGRSVEVRLGDYLEAVLFDDTGAHLASFPRKTKRDDAETYAAAKARHAALVEAADTVGRGQMLRFERAMRAGREWTVDALRTWVLPQPLVQRLARRLVWQEVESGTLFRVAEDLSLADENDEALAWPADDARVVIAHPVDAPKLSAFGSWLDDYAVVQPFRQIGREVLELEGDALAASRFVGVEGRKVPYLSVLALTLGMGWKPIVPGARGIDAITCAWDGVVARLEIRPGLLFGGAKGRPEQTLGVLTLEDEAHEPVSFAALHPRVRSELLRDVSTLG
ncbi:MAG: DUF4132 domain-containing protein [Sandaracinus sp.]|nr:DUF4132 domain-containing protein [Sandaracinus sp.]